MAKKEWTKESLTALLAKVGKSAKAATACAQIGHSRIVSMFIWYVYCGRCEAQIGDKLGSLFDDAKSPVLGHNCQICAENMKAMTWKDTFMVKGANALKKAKAS